MVSFFRERYIFPTLFYTILEYFLLESLYSVLAESNKYTLAWPVQLLDLAL